MRGCAATARTWTEPDGRPRRTSAGRSLAEAKDKAAEINADLQRATGPKGLPPLGQIMDEYLASPVVATTRRKAVTAAPSHLQQAGRVLRRTLRVHESVLAMEIDRAWPTACAPKPAPCRTAEANIRCEGVLRWGNTKGYFTPVRVEMLPKRFAGVTLAFRGTAARKRRRKDRRMH